MSSLHSPEPFAKGPLAWMASNPVAANILMWVFLIGGILAYQGMRKEVFPVFDLDIVTITVPYPGASPEDVEQGILLSIEEAISNVDGVAKVDSTAAEGSATITAEIREGENVQQVFQSIKQEVDRIQTLPADAEEPKVSLSTRKQTVMTLVLHGEAGDLSLRQIAEQFRDALLSNSGITLVDIAEARNLEIHIEVPESRLNAYGLTLTQIADRIRTNVVEVSGGSVSTQNGEILLRVSERRDLADQFERLPIITPANGSPILLRDLANVRDALQSVDRYGNFNGKNSVEMTVYRVGDQTPVSVSELTLKTIDSFKSTLPPTVDITVVNDRSEVYVQRQQLLMTNALQGLLLVMLMLTLFLDWKLAFWVSLGIPTAFIGSFLVLPHLGVTFNMISMFAFIIALGIVVDDAIVAGENIYEYRMQGMSLMQAAIQGARDIAVPIVFSVLTNIASFAPLLLMTGMLGKIWGVIPLVVCTVFIISLVEAIFILPAHLGASKPISEGNRFHRLQQRFSDGFSHWVEHRYGPFIKLCVQYRYVTIALGIGLTLIVLAWPISGRMGFELFPTVESDRSEVRAVLPLGTTDEQVRKVRDVLIESAQQAVQANGGEALSRGIYASVNENVVTVRMYLTPPNVRPVSTSQITDDWRTRTGAIAGVESMRFAADAGGPGSGPGISLQLSHRDVNVLRQASAALAAELTQFPVVSEVDDGFQDGKQQYNFTLKEEARRLGLSSTEIGRQVRAAFFGVEALRQQRGRNEIKILVTRPEDERVSQAQIRDLLIRTPANSLVPLHTVVEFNPDRAYSNITRRDGRRIITVTANVNPRKNAPQVQKTVEQDILPRLMVDYPGLSYDLSGRQADYAQSMADLKMGFGVALLVIYVLLAIPFRSYIQPMIVMLAIPFGMFGAIIGHLLLGYSMSLISVMGIIAVSGVVINGALVMVDQANQQTRKGVDHQLAICAAGMRRFRPIFLTTITTFGGLAPMIFETSRQARFMIPMALSLGFGVLFATAITLVLVPCFYLVIEDIKRIFGFASKNTAS